MSLENPSRIEKMIEALKNFSHWRIVGALVVVLALVGFVLFVADVWDGWQFERKQDKLKQNVNLAINEIQNRNVVIANLKEQQAVDVERVNAATKEYFDAIGASDAAKAETNRALSNMANAANGNGNISVEQLKEKLRGL